jgi:hypothetical protein
MHLSLILATAIARELVENTATAATVFAHGGTEDRALPLLAATIQNFRSPHPHLHQGELVLRYEYDADITPAATAALDLQAAADHLATSPALASINTRVNPDSVWLRRLTPAGGTTTPAETGERTRSMDLVMSFHCQTKI